MTWPLVALDETKQCVQCSCPENAELYAFLVDGRIVHEWPAGYTLLVVQLDPAEERRAREVNSDDC